jgi:hypothetical protein
MEYWKFSPLFFLLLLLTLAQKKNLQNTALALALRNTVFWKQYQ